MIDIQPSAWGLTGLECVYFTAMAVGVLYALIVLLGGAAGDMDVSVDLDADVGFDIGDVDGGHDLAALSPMAIAGFVTGFGASGVIARSAFDAGSGSSLVAAIVGGALIGLVAQAIFVYVFIKPQGSSEYTRRDVIGATGEVITPIPADSVGEIALVAQGARVTLTARSADGGAIPRGTMVRVHDQVGSVVRVSPMGAEPDDPPEEALPST